MRSVGFPWKHRKFPFLVGSAIKGRQGGPLEMLSKQLRQRQEFNKQSRQTMPREEITLLVSWVWPGHRSGPDRKKGHHPHHHNNNNNNDDDDDDDDDDVALPTKGMYWLKPLHTLGAVGAGLLQHYE